MGLRLVNVSRTRFAAWRVAPVEARVRPVDGREVGVGRVRGRQVVEAFVLGAFAAVDGRLVDHVHLQADKSERTP